MKVEFKDNFLKAYKTRFRHLARVQKQFEKRLRLFSENPANPILKDHALRYDMIGYRAFSITGDIRVVYYIEKGIAYFVDIGMHNQVYK